MEVKKARLGRERILPTNWLQLSLWLILQGEVGWPFRVSQNKSKELNFL